MAIVKKNNILSGLSGRVGNLVFRQVNGKTVVSARPQTRRKNSTYQDERKNRFSLAAAYARKQTQDPATRDEYTRGITDLKTSAYMVAFTDYMNPPQIEAVDTRAYRGKMRNTIRIKAIDDFKVVAVEVKIVNAAGVQVERGPALQVSRAQWHYHTAQDNPELPGTRVIVTARDKAGNEAVVEKLIG